MDVYPWRLGLTRLLGAALIYLIAGLGTGRADLPAAYVDVVVNTPYTLPISAMQLGTITTPYANASASGGPPTVSGGGTCCSNAILEPESGFGSSILLFYF